MVNNGQQPLTRRGDSADLSGGGSVASDRSPRRSMRSDMIKFGFERAPHRALLKATGVTDADMGKPLSLIHI